MPAPNSDRSSDVQRDRRQRGGDFQGEIRRSWGLVPNVWRARIRDGGGTCVPADEITLTLGGNILAELKRTTKDFFALSFLRKNQVQGLIDFDRVLPHNHGLVFISFENVREDRDEAYAFRLATALKYMIDGDTRAITLTAFRQRELPCYPLDRITIDGEPGYDIGGLVSCCRLL